jgi:hypothetical protein
MLSQVQHALRRGAREAPAALGAMSRLMSSSGELLDEESDDRPSTPWVRSVVSGVDLMRNAKVF